ncbi:hypothetical protein M878_24530 [Streptomyces roseochromogenus subsp. oscitans DS 12.976]|uniref:Uncharacterized protein n=1 Tax=Streptomyces roseochromogenus subsp. oscitans DS 12.976 TaxID=1352936 RepID=V6K862_STRRC|nr:hypothetical protein M878_24530 [Streptomyces roseochromogenus subsp. oscitans DS 12.976]
MNAAQLPAAGVLWLISTLGQDEYGAGVGGAFGVGCLLIFAPLLLPLLGLFVSVLLTLPALALTRSALRRFDGPEWAWRLAGAVAGAVGWGAVTTTLWHWPFVTTVADLTALGLLPALGITYVRTRSWSSWGLWWRSAVVCAGLFALALGGGVLATVTGLIKAYEPPRLTPAQLAGVWRGENGAELRLEPGGRASARRLPTQPVGHDWTADDYQSYVVCAGPGTWEPDPGTDHQDRAGVLVHLDGDCGLDTHWSVSGTEDAPRLFVLFGDPDAGTLRILDRADRP